MQKNIIDTMPILFAYLIAYFVRRNDDDDGHCWTELTLRHCRDRCRERKKREHAKRRIVGGTEKDRGGREGGHDELFYAAGAPLPHRRSRYRKLRALTVLRPHVRIWITAPCPPQDVRSDQPLACGTLSTASGHPLTRDRFICAV